MTKLLTILSAAALFVASASAEPLEVSGVYPSLTHYNSEGECGPGAVVPWAGKLWMVTYADHAEGYSDDKLYSIDPITLERTTFPGSVGGTPADRLIHRESQQLFIGSYAIDKDGHVRVISRDQKTGLYGRLGAVARHLTDPANKIYMYTMEGTLYEVDVHTLKVTKLFIKPVPGQHGKGAYTAQGRLVIANNGDVDVHPEWKKYYQVKDFPPNPENDGVLAEWDGKKWAIVERRQFAEVTGPGGIYGNSKSSDPLWALGWDKRSVILKLLDGGEWFTFRLPKGQATYDSRNGWYTEWPRIREVGDGHTLMDMHGLFYSFSKDFSAKNPQAPDPISSHLMMAVDFCDWNGRLVIGKHDTTLMGNPRAGRDQSAPWFGKWDDLFQFGPKQGYGSLWQNDSVAANTVSVPFLVKGFTNVTLFLSADHAAQFDLEAGTVQPGSGIVWKSLGRLKSGANALEMYPLDVANVSWVRLRATEPASQVHAAFQLTSAFTKADPSMFDGLAAIGEKSEAAWIRPAKAPSKALQVVYEDASGKSRYRETDPDTLITKKASVDDTATVEKLCAPTVEKARYDSESSVVKIWYDAASAIIKDKTGAHWRVPMSNPAYARAFDKNTPTAIREIVTERNLANIGGTFFLYGREGGISTLQPVCTHGKDIRDFCTWRGLLVLSGVKPRAKEDGHVFGSGNDQLWFGKEDDLWKMGKPVGAGGPWKNTAITAETVSDPYLMFGYDHKKLTLSDDAQTPVTYTAELDVDHAGFLPWKTFTVKPGEKLEYTFPPGFSAFWIRFKADAACHATAQLEYR